MRHLFALAATVALATCGMPQVAVAQTHPTFPTNIATVRAPGSVILVCDSNGANCAPASATNPLPISGGGGGGGGGGDASAANQATQIQRETSIRDQIGALSSPASGSTNQLLTALGTAQAGTTAALPAKDVNGDLRVPTVTVAFFFASLPANSSTEVLAASTTRIGYEIQCAGTAPVAISSTHATLTAVTPSASNAADMVIPQGTFPAYIPAYVSGLGVTAYSGTAQACWGKTYARQ